MSAPRGNEWDGELRNSTAGGTALTPGNNTYPATVEVFGAGLWPTTTRADDGYALEANINGAIVSAASKDLKVNLCWVITYTGDTGVDAGADTITFPTPHGLDTADVCTFATTGVITVGLNTTNDWYVIRVDAFTVAFGTNEANARADVRRNLSAGASGTHTLTCRKIQHLSGSESQLVSGASGGGHTFLFPIWIPSGTVIHATASVNNATVGTVNVLLRVFTKPTKPWTLRTGTFVRTFGAVPASSAGTAITPVNGSKSGWVDLGAVAENLWFWNPGVGYDNAAYPNNNVHLLDLAVGETGTERLVVRDAYVLPSNGESLNTPVFQHWAAEDTAAAENVFVRMQSNGTTSTGWSVLAYGVGGKFEPLDLDTVDGVVMIDGAPAPSGEDVQIFARDSDGNAELVATVLTDVFGGFTAQCPIDGRAYFARYAVGGGDPPGCSFDDVPGAGPFDIEIFTGGGGGGETVPPVQTVVSPAAGTSFAASYDLAKDVPAIVNVIDASSAIAFVAVYVKFSDRSATELVYAGAGAGGYVSPYISYSTVTGTGAAGVGYQFSIRRDDGWPKSTNGNQISAAFTYKAVDAEGNVLT